MSNCGRTYFLVGRSWRRETRIGGFWLYCFRWEWKRDWDNVSLFIF